MERVYVAELEAPESPIGTLRLASTERGLACVQLPAAGGRGFAGWLARHAPGAVLETAFAPNREAARQLAEYLAGKRAEFELPVDLRGTDFQRAVWSELRRIPYGEVRSYADVARAIGAPHAVRAVGAANGANPLAIVVPCHRVVATGGALGGYGGGAALKRWLLMMERGHVETGAQGRLL
ncbi:MAG TPA: methylated-DNA--[protein]-cysteine S-methyltransferase [Myxococcota bacterium]|jgi:O-6-methylguanine DNA methyltransferase|nr:methylated-DNA--[protein]-cysteine S-methyltransferase [Myxococcota bacterium]